MMSDKKKEIDEISGVETTGHEWDGLKELNTPLPRWWVWVFIVTIIWSIWYFVVYPSWPVPGVDNQGGTVGSSGYTQYEELKKNQAQIFARQEKYLDRFESASLNDIMNDSELYAFAVAGGASAFKDNCATCHGTGAQGSKGYPNLNDDDWIWGGQLAEIHQTLQYGVRADNWDTRMSDMPAFGADELLEVEEINAVVDYVLSMSGSGDDHGHGVDMAKGHEVYQMQCASCHGEDGKGMHEMGAPNLTDKIWLYGGDRDDVYETVYNARRGMMPAWGERLDENTIKQLAVYVHQLGGGEQDIIEEDMPAEEEPVVTPEDVMTEQQDTMMIEGENHEQTQEQQTENTESGSE
jgi:cytochrome c oxidase cbb3-type subunit 3